MVKSFKTNILAWLKTKTYIKTEIDNFLNGKSDTNHTHTQMHQLILQGSYQQKTKQN